MRRSSELEIMIIKPSLMRQQVFSLLLIIFAATLPSALNAHGPMARIPEATAFQARLFTADAATGEVVAIDLPNGKLVGRLSTPPFIMALALSHNQRYLFVQRGRSTDRDFVTIIDTGVDPSEAQARPPYIARTILGQAPFTGGKEQISTVAEHDALLMQDGAEIIVMDAADYTSMAGVQPITYKLANPDHYSYVESGAHLYVGHLRSGMIQVLDRSSGKEVSRIGNCNTLHGIQLDEQTGRILVGCNSNVMIIGSRGAEANVELGRVNYPIEQRAAVFMEGKNRVIWAFTEGTLPALYRLDLKAEPWTFDVLPVSRAIQQHVSADGNYLLVYTRSGELEIRDGDSGQLLRKLTISGPVELVLDEHVDKAILPGIVTLDSTAFVSLPYEGRIVAVDIERGTVTNTFDIGGEPTRMVVVANKTSPKILALADQAAEGRWYGADEISAGANTYRLNCAVCHGEQAQGNFGQGNIDSTPVTAPPPLNGSAHAAHHSLADMLEVIDSGVDPVMPAYSGLLSNQEKRAVVAYYQSLWPKDVYDEWVEVYGQPQINNSVQNSDAQKATGHSHDH